MTFDESGAPSRVTVAELIARLAQGGSELQVQPERSAVPDPTPWRWSVDRGGHTEIE